VIAAATATVGLHRLIGLRDGGLPVVGQVIPAERAAAPGISGTTLTGQRLNIAAWRGRSSGATTTKHKASDA